MSQLTISYIDLITESDVRSVCGYNCKLGTYLDTRIDFYGMWSYTVYVELNKLKSHYFIVKQSNVNMEAGTILSFKQLFDYNTYRDGSTIMYVIEDANIFRCPLLVTGTYCVHPKTSELQVKIYGIVGNTHVSFLEVIRNYRN